MSKTVKCNICLEENIENPVFTPCIHGFCSECISKWISEKKQYIRIPCPVCKFDIAPLAGHRDESQLYDESEPLPRFLLQTTINNTLRQLPRQPEPPRSPEFVLRGLGIEEIVPPVAPINIFRRVYDTRAQPIHRHRHRHRHSHPAMLNVTNMHNVPNRPSMDTQLQNIQRNLDGLMQIINARRVPVSQQRSQQVRSRTARNLLPPQ